MNKKYLILIGLTIVIGSLFFLFKKDTLSPSNSTLPPMVVIFNEEGFTPNEITILQGQRVTFKTTTDKQFWPASDSHPSHTIYSEFDPLEPVDQNKSWTFVFDKVGTWQYHDHLDPSYLGEVNVLSGEANSVSSDLKSCDLNKSSNNEKCWNYLIKKGWEDNGSSGALKVLASLYDTSDENFPRDRNCHRDTHTIGELAVDEYYKDLNNYTTWKFAPETFYCGYGFFHGLFEHLFIKVNNTNVTIDICESISKNYSSEFPSIRRNCYHGMGHAFMGAAPPKGRVGRPTSHG